MRVFVPRHIEWWMFNMNLSLGPLNISMIQLFILAIWVAISLSLWNWLTNAWLDNTVAAILVAPIVIIFIFVAFFKMSELTLLPFIAKLLRTYFFDATKKYYVNCKKVDPIEVMKKKIKQWKPEQKIQEKKPMQIDQEKMRKLDSLLE